MRQNTQASHCHLNQATRTMIIRFGESGNGFSHDINDRLLANNRLPWVGRHARFLQPAGPAVVF